MSSHRERTLSGKHYLASDPELVAAHRRARLIVERFNLTSVTEEDQRQGLLGELLGSIGGDTVVKPPFQCDYGFTIAIGARTFMNYGTVILDCAPVTIGDEVQIATGVQLLTATHPLEAEPRRRGWESAEPVAIGNGAWLGSGAIVCPGVTIGEDTVVGAGSVVTRDLPAGVLAVGNPCRVIRQL